MSDNHETRSALNSVRYMNAYERAHAQRHMEQAMAVADLIVRASDRVRTAPNVVRNALHRIFAQSRRPADKAVSYRG